MSSWLPVQKLRPGRFETKCKSAYLNTQCDPPNFERRPKSPPQRNVQRPQEETAGTKLEKETEPRNEKKGRGKLTQKHQNGGWQLHDLARIEQEASSSRLGPMQGAGGRRNPFRWSPHKHRSHGIVYERERERELLRGSEFKLQTR
jgi:hypothetical protein